MFDESSIYKLKDLAGKYYIDYAAERTDYNFEAVELTLEQSLVVQKFERDEFQKRQDFLKSIIDNA